MLFVLLYGMTAKGWQKIRIISVVCKTRAFNFNEGLKKTKENLSLFDNITFIDGNSDFGKVVALHIGRDGIHEVTNNPPLWFKEYFEKLFADLLKR